MFAHISGLWQPPTHQNVDSTHLLATYLLWLHRLTGRARRTIAVRRDGRGHPGLATALGPFARYLPLTVSYGPDFTWNTWIEHVDAELRQLDARQDYFDPTQLQTDDEVRFLPFRFDATTEVASPEPDVALDLGEPCHLSLSCRRSNRSRTGTWITTWVRDSRLYPLGEVTQLAASFARLLDACLHAADSTPLPTLAATLDPAALPTVYEPSPLPERIVPVARPARVPASFAQQRLWLVDRLHPGSAIYNLPQASRLRGPLHLDRLQAALDAVLRRHESLRTAFEEHDGAPWQRILPSSRLHLPMVDLSGLPESRRWQAGHVLAAHEARRPFDLRHGPMLRGLLLRLQVDTQADAQAGDHALLLTLHHIAGDGWSLPILQREITTLAAGGPQALPRLHVQYADFTLWQRARLRGAHLQALLDWWRKQLAEQPESLSLPFDHAHKRDGKDRPIDPTRGGNHRHALSAELAGALRDLAATAGASYFMVLLAALYAWLGRITGQRHVAVGSATAGRDRVEIEGLIGFFVNTLVLPVDLGAGGGSSNGLPNFRNLLAQARDTALEAQAHAEVPFERLVAELAPRRSADDAPLVQVMLVVQNLPNQASPPTSATPTSAPATSAPATSRTTGGTRLEGFPSNPTTDGSDPEQDFPARFDLTLTADVPGPGQDGLLSLTYRRSRFDSTTARRCLTQLVQLLRGAAARPDTAVAELPLFDAGQRQQLLHEWSQQDGPRFKADLLADGSRDTGTLARNSTTLAGALPRQLRRWPDAIAVVDGRRHLSHGRLLVEAERVATRLRALGVPVGEEAVAVLTGGRPEPVALLAVYLAGAAFLPLDADQPSARLARILDDARPRAVLLPPGTEARLPSEPEIPHRIPLAPDNNPTTEPARRTTEPAPHPDQLAYVIYTSGTTGRPKAAGNTHHGILPFLAWVLETYPLRRGWRTLPHLSPAFDVGFLELTSTLLAGGTLVLPPERDLRRMARWIERWSIQIVHGTPSSLTEIVEAARRERRSLHSLRVVDVAGEAFPLALQEKLQSTLAPDCRIWNLYGPSEASIACAAYLLPARRPDIDQGVRGSVPIGTALGNARVLLLDAAGQPVPPGVAGELFVGGVETSSIDTSSIERGRTGVGRGYLGRPARTAGSFLPDAFCTSHNSGARLYRTGDLVRRHADGRLEFLSRRDHQIKLRGIRIEIGEIEAALYRHPKVAEAAVELRRDLPGGAALVAFVTLHAEEIRAAETHAEETGSVQAPARETLLDGELRAFLVDQLPVAMVPTRYEILDALPRTPNRKLDCKALQRLDLGHPAGPPGSTTGTSTATPQGATPRETGTTASEPVLALIREIWAGVLERPAASIRPADDFFQLGGHSLLATRVVGRLQESLDVDLPLRALFDHPTLGGQAVLVAARRQAGHATGSSLPAITARSDLTEAPLSFAQQRLWFLELLQPGDPAYNLPSALRLRGPLHVERLATALTRVCARHASLRTVFRPTHDPGVPAVQIALPIGSARIPVVDLSRLTESAPDLLRRLIRHEASRPFDLRHSAQTHQPLLRALLLRLDRRDHALVINQHHIISDGWSMGILTSELTVLYAAGSPSAANLHQEANLPALTVQYLDYARWQHEHLGAAALEHDLAYWRQRLAAAPPRLELPFDRPPHARPRRSGATVPVHVPAAVACELHTLAQSGGATLFMALLAAFQTLLARHIPATPAASTWDVSVGTPIAGRTRPELETLIGCFVNTLVLRARPRPKESFVDLLQRVRGHALDAHAHQHLPFERLVEAVSPRRSLEHTPLFQVLFALQNTPKGQVASGDLYLEPLATHSAAAKFDLSLLVTENAGGLEQGGLTGSLEYDADLFDRTTAQRLVRRYLRLLAVVAEEPLQGLARLPMLDDAEHHQLLWEAGLGGWHPWSPAHSSSASRTGSSQLYLEARQGVEGTADVDVGKRDGNEIGEDLLDAPLAGIVRGIWAEVLERPTSSMRLDDDFFQLGGHSLLATRVTGRLLDVLNVDLPLRTLFEHPTLASLSQEIQTRRGQAAGTLSPSAPPLTAPGPGHERTEAPLSFAQQRLWLLEQLRPGDPAYNLPMALRLRGPLDPRRLARAFDTVVARHHSLRSVFVAGAEGRGAQAQDPRQIVQPATSVPLPTIDLRGFGGAVAQELIRREAARPFDLRRGPMLRVLLLRLAEDEHALVVNQHHIISDGWSLGLLTSELSRHYAQPPDHRSIAQPEARLQYPDFAAWQRSQLGHEALEHDLAWWRQQLASAPARLELPFDRPPTLPGKQLEGPRRPGATCAVHLSADATSGLHRLARREGATLFMVLLAAFQTLLARHLAPEAAADIAADAGAWDISVGTPTAGRTRPELETLIGFFVNTLVLRSQLHPEESFQDLLRRVRQFTHDAHDHQSVPFERLVEEVAPERSLLHTPLFQVMLALQNVPQRATAGGDLVLERLPAHSAAAKFDLTLNLTETRNTGASTTATSASGLHGSLEYDTLLFDATTARRLAHRFERVLVNLARSTEGAAVGASEARVPKLRDLDLFGPAQRHQLLLEWGQGSERNGDIHRASEHHPLFASIYAQAQRQPDAIAVAGERRHLSYGTLRRRAGNLASTLRARGLRREESVGVRLERSVELVIALLGVLEAGGTYLPLDAHHPRTRQQQSLDEAAARLLLTRPQLSQSLSQSSTLDTPEGGSPKILESLDLLTASEELGTIPAAPAVHPDQLAYLIFTSGTTGRPKGVALTHAQAAPLITSAPKLLGLRPGHRVLEYISPAFDYSVFKLLSTLHAGATLVDPGAHRRRDAARFEQLLRRYGIDVFLVTPSLVAQLTSRLAEPTLPVVEILHLAGEALPANLLPQLGRAFPRARLYNHYGPTEGAISAAMMRLDADTLHGKVPVPASPSSMTPATPIGRPTPGKHVYVLDAWRRPVPLGVPGELCIGGQVARGYLGDAAKTATSFLPDAFTSQAGGRIYETGDLVRHLADGQLQFLGRADAQVKLRGFRIELGEVEAALVGHPAVSEAVALVHGEGPEARLVAAYVATEGTAAEGTAPEPGELREFLSHQLPAALVPGGFLQVDTLPRTSAGKLDRRALAQAAAENAAENTAALGARVHEPPEGELEAILAEYFEELLGIEQVGRHDDFFDLGGHSMVATWLIGRIAEELGVELPLQALFEAPTIAGLARLITPRLPDGAPT